MSTLGRFAKIERATSRSGNGIDTITCSVGLALGEGKDERKLGTEAGVVDKLSEQKGRIILMWVCKIGGACSHCSLADLAQKSDQ
jgi:hypothetical protein